MKMNDATPKLIHLAETDSTNRHLQRLLQADAALADETVAIADFQTSGRGQIGNVWESEAGQNLTFSLLYKPQHLPANQPFRIAQIAALSVKKTLDKYVSGITVKWPNDIYRRNLKICGMLIENTLSGGFITHSIIGIGLNINQTVFRSDAPNPVSLSQITGEKYDCKQYSVFGRRNFTIFAYSWKRKASKRFMRNISMHSIGVRAFIRTKMQPAVLKRVSEILKPTDILFWNVATARSRAMLSRRWRSKM